MQTAREKEESIYEEEQDHDSIGDSRIVWCDADWVWK